MPRKEFQADFSKSLPRAFFMNSSPVLARKLLGKVLVKYLENGEYLAGMIVETEAYLHENDAASHSAPGETARNTPMFRAGGILYVYLIYGIYNCINIVADKEGKGSAVLIRALEPLSEIEIMKENRRINDIHRLCKGPGCLAQAFGFDRKDNFRSLCTPVLFVQNWRRIINKEIRESRRIGIVKSAELPLRYYIKDSDFTSK